MQLINIFEYTVIFNISVQLQFYNLNMACIFLQLTDFKFQRKVLESITEAATNKKVSAAIDKFYASEQSNQGYQNKRIQFIRYANVLIDLVSLTSSKQGKQKLLIALVYFIVKVDEKEALNLLTKVQSLNQTVILKVKFYSFVFKSTESQSLKKWLIQSTVSIIENEEKVSLFAGLIQHFDQVLQTLSLTEQQTFQIYSKLISYLQKHPVYKKLCSNYVIRSLLKVTDKSVNSEDTKKLIIKVIKSGVISDNALNLLNHEVLKKHELYEILQILLTGDFEKLDEDSKKKLEANGIVGDDVLRKMKVEAIPRKLSNVKIASYDQVAEILKIKKSQVESYVIDAIRQGIIKAKLDEFQQTVIINRVNFRALRQEERAKLQKDITNLCDQLSTVLVKDN